MELNYVGYEASAMFTMKDTGNRFEIRKRKFGTIIQHTKYGLLTIEVTEKNGKYRESFYIADTHVIYKNLLMVVWQNEQSDNKVYNSNSTNNYFYDYIKKCLTNGTKIIIIVYRRF